MGSTSKEIKSGIIIGLSFLFTITIGSVVYAAIGNIWTSPDSIETSSGNLLTSASWNVILANSKNHENRINTIYNSATSNIITGFTQCTKITPTKNNTYECDGTVSGSPAVSDIAVIKCPSGYKAVGGGGYLNSSGAVRQSHPTGGTYIFGGTNTIGSITVVCMKVE